MLYTVEALLTDTVLISGQLYLRWLATVSSTFHEGSLMGHYNHSIPADTKIIVSTNSPIIGEQVAVNFVAQ